MATSSLLRTKSIDQSIEDTKDSENGLRRTLGPLDLALGAATVASGWSDYFRVVMHDTLGVNLPTWIDGSHHNLIAALLVLAITGLVVYFAYGRRHSRVG